jgi:hypothetical protein
MPACVEHSVRLVEPARTFCSLPAIEAYAQDDQSEQQDRCKYAADYDGDLAEIAIWLDRSAICRINRRA